MFSSRMGEFAAGASPTETPSLMQRADKFNSQDPHQFKANGLNEPYMLSKNNGNSQQDALRQTPGGELPSQNGYAANTYQALDPSIGTRLI
jgi:hypothetical protein